MLAKRESQRLKPPLQSKRVIAAVNRCATQTRTAGSAQNASWVFRPESLRAALLTSLWTGMRQCVRGMVRGGLRQPPPYFGLEKISASERRM